MKWLLLFCLLAVHQISAMPNKKEEEEDKLDVRADEFNEELRVEEESKLIHKRPVEFDTEEGEEAEEEDKEERKLNSRKKRCEKGCGGEDDSSEENLDVDVNVNFNAHQPNFKADVDVNVNINAENSGVKGDSQKGCKEGDTWMEDCNSCHCVNGAPSCTKMACLPTVPPACQDGDHWMDDCNTCSCSNGVAFCTLMFCPQPVPQVCDNKDPLIGNPCCFCFEGQVQCSYECLLTETTETTPEGTDENSTDTAEK